MSVWANPTFRQTVPNILAKYLAREDFLELPHILDFPINDSENLLGLKEYSTWRQLLKEEPIMMSTIYDFYPYESDESVYKALSGYDRIESGLEAVYRVIVSLYKGYIEFTPQLPWDRIKPVVQACAKVVAPSTQINKAAWMEWFTDDTYYDSKMRWENYAEAFKNMQLRLKSKDVNKVASAENEIYDFDDTNIIKTSTWKILAKQDLFIFCGREFMSSIALVLSLEDMQKIYKTCYCISKVLEYGEYYTKEAIFRDNPFEKTLEHIIKTLDRTRGANVHSIARAYHPCTLR